jgi:hypothetical protein
MNRSARKFLRKQLKNLGIVHDLHLEMDPHEILKESSFGPAAIPNLRDKSLYKLLKHFWVHPEDDPAGLRTQYIVAELNQRHTLRSARFSFWVAITAICISGAIGIFQVVSTSRMNASISSSTLQPPSGQNPPAQNCSTQNSATQSSCGPNK